MFKIRIWLFVIVAWVFVPVAAMTQKDKAAAEPAASPDGAKQTEVSSPEAGQKTPDAENAPPAAVGSSKGETAGEGASSASNAPMTGDTYTVRLRDLEDRINRLKEQIFRSKARLSLLAETVLDRKIAGAKSTIVFLNKMGGSFRLVRAVFLLDGAAIFNKTDEGGSLADRDVISLFDGPVMPGDHTLSAVLHYRGHGFGIFSYLKGYSFKTRSSRTFTVNEGKALRLEVVGYEKGGATTPLEDRPDIRYAMTVSDYEGAAPAEEEEPPVAQGVPE